jgi:5-methylcytosine-specific restriction protein A
MMATLILRQANATKIVGIEKQQRQKIYNTQRWVKLRKEILIQHPICQRCGVRLSEHVHHIISFMNYSGYERIAVAYNSDNLMALCEPCHRLMHKRHENKI